MAQPQASLQAADFGAGEGQDSKNFWALALGSAGVVFGDIGTSPLYAFKEAITAATQRGLTTAEATLGVLSLIFWSMTLVVTMKYVLLLLRADNKGEGGTFALMALGQTVAKRSAPLLGALGIAGASFFYGDAVITPAISVLSAVEGLKLVAPQFEEAVIPVSIVILTVLFWMQSRGTDRVAKFFGPVMCVWFTVLALGGLMHIADNFHVLKALESSARHLVRLPPRHHRSDGHGSRVSGLYRRRGALRRPRTFRSPSDHDRVALLRHAGAGAELFRARRARDERLRTRSRIRSIVSIPISR